MLKSKSLIPFFIFALLFFAAADTAFAQTPPSGELRGQVLISYPTGNAFR